jgi:deoxyhypusine monooxygenase
MAFAECPQLDVLRESLWSTTETIGKRTHSAFYLRSFYKDEAVDILCKALKHRPDSSLLRHELAYILGQLRDSRACPCLISIVEDEDDDVLVRHEAAEALGAIGDKMALPVLEKYSQHASRDISETCKIAIDLIRWRDSGEVKPASSHQSVDPAPPLPSGQHTVDELKGILMDTSKSLFDRYRAMFTLRDMNSDESSLALLAGFQDESPLFRHEVAYVLGQMEKFVTVDGLSEVLMNKSEHGMVRHEAAEALGAIGGKLVEELLNKFRDDEESVVKESCDVALDNIEYWS